MKSSKFSHMPKQLPPFLQNIAVQVPHYNIINFILTRHPILQDSRFSSDGGQPEGHWII